MRPAEIVALNDPTSMPNITHPADCDETTWVTMTRCQTTCMHCYINAYSISNAYFYDNSEHNHFVRELSIVRILRGG